MKTLKQQALKRHIAKKGITIDAKGRKLFDKFDYYQVINGYKYLFVNSVEKIDDIKRKINSSINSHETYYSNFYGIKRYSSKSDLYEKVCREICNKYGLDLDKHATINQLEAKIKKIGYERHVFSSECNFEDFVRLYLFEHELRNCLLKYVLLIEEKIKKVFVTTLNDLEEDANCLTDISNYNISGGKKSMALDSLKKVIEMHKNKDSKPIVHKMEQELVVPYWILINEMTLKQTLITACYLEDSLFKNIYQNLTNNLSNCNLNIFDRTKSTAAVNNEKYLIKQFTDILFHLADFRNHLAHNQPLYCYNTKRHFPKQMEMPFLDTHSSTYRANKSAGMSDIDQQRQIILPLLNATISFFGADTFNTRPSSSRRFDINLSWIIYVINRIINVISPKNSLKEEICDLFKKFNIVLSYSSDEYSSKSISSIINFLSTGKAHNGKTYFNTNKVNNLIKKLNKENKKSMYRIFNRNIKYCEYTGIDNIFLGNILC